jgi:hypothetical protein
MPPVHGWIDGHPHTPGLDADFGDFASLLEHLNADADANNYDLLVFDSGDLIEGTGLSDASAIHGQYIFPIIEMVGNYTALTIGNHDVGRSDTIALIKRSFIPFFNPPNQPASAQRYFTSNTWTIGRTIQENQTRSHGKPQSQAQSQSHHGQEIDSKFLGQPWSITTTQRGLRLMLLGFIFNFTQEASNTVYHNLPTSYTQQVVLIQYHHFCNTSEWSQ